ncbi:peptidylprolyl isomerase [Echinimonas agarilytica]|uniref:Peptidyl-prolyl cis-trans isomerase C n=1 Tax=Echinimonas agarilytica TaxID=1215918 RepID=A0AA41W7D9_9GAMM|nr:peptidylprolyl isomerase [Echinimonas agarilytica]MCM2680577.1 peptidylprolyl isomerase [Echinimonas agarilytica]
MARASAHALHILVDSEAQALELRKKIENGSDFGDVAKRFSTCPSSKKGGDLGMFNKGDMVASFDKAVFSGELFKILGPVKTQFGFHLIKVIDRTG